MKHFVLASTVMLVALLVSAIAFGANVGPPPAVSPEASTEKPVVQVDPLLKKAWDYWNDWDNKDREVQVQLFEDYLRANPESPLAPEICFDIATLYSTKRNRKAGEERDIVTATRYFELARQGYGRKFDPGCYNAIAWATLANYSGDCAKQRELYDWILYIEKSATADDIYPVFSIAGIMKGTPLYASDEVRQESVKSLSHALPGFKIATEANMLHVASRADLVAIIRDFPGTDVAKRAQQLLDRNTEVLARSLKSVLASPLEDDASVEEPPEPVEAAALPEPPVPAALPQPAPKRLEIWQIAAIVVCVAAVLALIWRIRRRKPE